MYNEDAKGSTTCERICESTITRSDFDVRCVKIAAVSVFDVRRYPEDGFSNKIGNTTGSAGNGV